MALIFPGRGCNPSASIEFLRYLKRGTYTSIFVESNQRTVVFVTQFLDSLNGLLVK